ncbi:MAG: hypothetical protein HY744_10850 [Deltaproteobacteria bacterium]|nr:hypothetical protein [Deltaproteobacteria bacterium]
MNCRLRCCLLAALLLASCRERPRPWEAAADGAAAPPVEPFLPAPADASWLGDGGLLGTAGGEGGGPATPLRRLGGLWVGCHDGFRPSGEPVKDVTRLSLMCGPANGMQPLSDQPLTGRVQAGEPPVRHRFQAVEGECYRIFAVAEPSAAGLDVTVRSSRGSRLAGTWSEPGWPIVEPDRPFCTFAAGTFVVEVTARQGSGPYALQIWRLPARPGDAARPGRGD